MLKFPDCFLWGTATSAYQVEGSLLADGAGVSICHRFAHTPANAVNGENGDVACATIVGTAKTSPSCASSG